MVKVVIRAACNARTLEASQDSTELDFVECVGISVFAGMLFIPFDNCFGKCRTKVGQFRDDSSDKLLKPPFSLADASVAICIEFSKPSL